MGHFAHLGAKRIQCVRSCFLFFVGLTLPDMQPREPKVQVKLIHGGNISLQELDLVDIPGSCWGHLAGGLGCFIQNKNIAKEGVSKTGTIPESWIAVGRADKSHALQSGHGWACSSYSEGWCGPTLRTKCRGVPRTTVVTTATFIMSTAEFNGPRPRVCGTSEPPFLYVFSRGAEDTDWKGMIVGGLPLRLAWVGARGRVCGV